MHKRALLAAVALVCAALGCGDAARPDPESRRRIRQSELLGSRSEDGAAHIWRGIPFAQPPVDELRWRAPRPPEPLPENFEALVSGSACPQLGGDPVRGSEDCLYLDVYAPRFAPDAVPTGSARLPVMFWIHGGGNSMGSGADIPPTRLAAEHDVVVVTINYRLGVFGWLSHSALRASAAGPEDASGNFGTLDMIRGLEWVRDHIEAFGGDPQRVTIFGESAGGINVYTLLLSPRARGLFRAAISQSGMVFTLTRPMAENLVDATPEPGLHGSSGELLVALLMEAGRAPDRRTASELAASMELHEIESFLRGHSTGEILAPFVASAENAGSDMPLYMSPHNFRDGHVIVDMDARNALSTPGAHNAVPLIAGTNRDEHKLFYFSSSPHVSRTLGLPTGFVDERLYNIEGEYGGLLWRAMGVDEPFAALHRAGGAPIYAYRFDWDELPVVFGLDLSTLLGAAHALDLFFVFGLTDFGLGNRFVYADPVSAETLSRAMRSYWTHFAYSLAPDRGREDELPYWPVWNPEADAPKYLVFDTEADGGLRTGSDHISQLEVLAAIRRDPRLRTPEERCRVLRNMVQWGDALSPDAYAAIEECRPYPLASRVHFATLPADL